MDWAPVTNPFVDTNSEKDLNEFRYTSPAKESDCATVLGFRNGHLEVFPLGNEGDWETWFKSDTFGGAHLDGSGQHEDLSGFHILMSAVVEPLVFRTYPKLIEFSRPHNNLPFSEAKWKKVIEAFPTPRTTLHPARRNRCQSTFTVCKYPETELEVELFTAVAAPYSRTGSFSLSSTYLRQHRLSLAVFYACTVQQVQRVIELVQNSPEVASHPLLVAGLFAELQMDRVQEVVREVHTKLDTNLRLYDNQFEMGQASRVKNLNTELRDGIKMAKKAEEELRTTSAQLKEMADRIDKQKKAWEANMAADGTINNNFAESAERFKARFDEMHIELEALMGQCRMAAEQQAYAGTLTLAEVSRKEAALSRLHSEHSKYLATIATIFLPITSVATVFAVPAFQFQHRWVDTNFNPVEGSSSSGDSNGSSSTTTQLDSSSMPVFSGYGVIFIVLSIALTAGTNCAYYVRKRRSVVDNLKEFEAV